MADISMCRNDSCPRRNLCSRHPEAKVYTVSPRRQSYQGYKLEDGKCRGWSYKLAEDTPGDELATHVLPEVWAQVDPLIAGRRLASAAMTLAELLGCRPLTAYYVMRYRYEKLVSAENAEEVL